MKRNHGLLTLALAFLLGAALVLPAEAGLFGRSQRDRDREAKTWRFDRVPTMGFASGTLRRSSLRSWKLDEIDLRFAPGCRFVGRDGEVATPDGGDRVIVMGPRVGNTIVAWQVRVLPPDYLFAAENPRERVRWSESDPTVGEGYGPE